MLLHHQFMLGKMLKFADFLEEKKFLDFKI